MNEKTFEKIEAYLAGELSQAEVLAFEEEIKGNPALAEELAIHRDTHHLLALGTQLDYKAKLKEIDKKMQGQPKVRSLFRNSRVWLAAATIIIGVSVVILSLGRNGQPNYEAEFAPYPDLTSMRNDTLSELRTGMIAYSKGQFEIAIDYLEKFLGQNPEEDYIHLYLGNSFLALKQYDQAIVELKLVSSPTWIQPAEWYLALALGANGQKEEAQKLLKKISADPNHAYKDKAQEMQ